MLDDWLQKDFCEKRLMDRSADKWKNNRSAIEAAPVYMLLDMNKYMVHASSLSPLLLYIITKVNPF